MTSLPRVLHKIGLALCAVLVLSSCKVDQSISLNVNPNGSGTVRVTVTANKAIVDAVPTLAQDVRTKDLVKAGWDVNGPTATEAGGLTVELSRRFNTPSEATAIISQISESKGPLHKIALARSGKDTNSVWNLTGWVEVNGGLDSFVDDATRELLGTTPYAADVSEANLDLGDAVNITFTATLPGAIDSTTGLQSDGAVSWRVPMDGSKVDVATTSTHVAVASSISRVARPVIVGLLVLWVAATVILLLLVANARNRRQRTPRL